MALRFTVTRLLAVACALVVLGPAVAADGDNGNGSTVARYRAEQKDKKLTVFATGKNPTGGWGNRLVMLPRDVDPPEFKFIQTKPDKPATQAFSSFAVALKVDAPRQIDHVFVTDAKGKHKVRVKQEP